MRKVAAADITAKVKDLCVTAAYKLEEDVAVALRGALDKEKSPLGKDILGQIVENFEIAAKEDAPMCQDTGIAVFFVDIGREVELDGSIDDALNEGVRQGYEAGYLRKSVCHPFSRKNTGDNTPAIIHTRIVEGDKVKVVIAPKGGGSENMSRLRMLKPAQGVQGVKDFVVDTVVNGGGNPCPPIIVGVGVGGNFEMSAMLAKRALLRRVGDQSTDPEMKAIEVECLDRINKTGIGPMGFGGITTALAVNVEMAPCHIASLPVAVNIQCHAARHKEAII